MKTGINALNLRKGAWDSDEDTLLRKCIQKYGEGKWHLVPHRAGLNRCRKSCRLRWLNYLRPTINRGEFGADEVDLMIRLHRLLGNRWSLIGGRLPGRTANDVKNYWNTNIQKKLTTLQKSELVQGKQVMSNNIANTSTATIVIKPLPRKLSKATTFPSYNLMSFGSEDMTLHNNNSKPSSPATLPPNDYGIEGLPPNDDGIEWWKNLFADMDIYDQEQDSTEGVLMASSGVLEDLEDGERGLIWKTDESTDPATEGWSDIWDLLNSSDDI